MPKTRKHETTASNTANNPSKHGSEEVDELCENYRLALNDLKINSKPIINSLTMIADENQQHADAISQEIVEQIDNVVAERKLPLLYLIDSILKNIGKVYITVFASRIADTFSSIYQAVSHSTREKMKRVLSTWHSIFDSSIIKSIETSCGISSTSSPPKKPVPNSSASQPPPAKRQRIQLAQPIPPSVPIMPPMIIQQPPLLPLYAPPISMQILIGNINALILQLQQHTFKYPSDSTAQGQLAALQQLITFVSATQLTQQQFDQVSNQIANISHIVQRVLAEAQSNPPPPSMELRKRPLSAEKIILSTDSIKREYPRAYDKLYDDLGLQCKQCGIRLKDDEKGSAKMQSHLDWHFRINRKTQLGQTSFSRDWFLNENDWVNLGNVDTTSGQVPAFFESKDNDNPELISASQTADESDIIETGKSGSVPGGHDTCGGVPMNDNHKNCGICHELFEKYWDHDEEEWMFKGAVIIDGAYYHKVCYDEKVGGKKSRR